MNEAVRHARSYPFGIPGHSYLFEAGGFRRLEPEDLDRDRRTPVLAAGSNQSPEQLARKFGSFATGPAGPIPAQRGVLAGFDVVYAAHLARYGSVPATFQASPGTAVTVFVLWLDEAQLGRMHETEGNYTFDRLGAISLVLEDGGILEAAFSYSSKVGCLNVGGGCASLAEISARGRRYPALAQHQALAAVRDRLEPGRALDDFIRAHVEDDGLLRARSHALADGAVPLGFAREILAVL